MSLSVPELVFLALAAVAGGLVNALAGGGTLITFPALTAVGVPALNANVTNTIALLPGYLGGTYAQRRDLEGQRDRLLVVALPAIAGGFVGGLLLLMTGEKLFRDLVPWLILLATALLALEPPVKRSVARRLGSSERPAPVHLGAAALAAFAGSVYGGYFGAGLGIILLALFSLVLPESLTRINALKQAVSFLANGAAAVLFALTGHVVWLAALVMAAGALLGGSLGGRFATVVSPGRLRVAVVGLGIVVALVYFVR